jgi:hypothetical protein
MHTTRHPTSMYPSVRPAARDGATALEPNAPDVDTPEADRPGSNMPEPARDAGFVISEGLAYAVLFVGVMVAAAAAFTGLAEQVVTQIQSILGI